MTSIHDVAALAKVSIKTVSRVVNKAPNVSEELRARVQAAIEQLGYRPNQSARRLAGGRPAAPGRAAPGQAVCHSNPSVERANPSVDQCHAPAGKSHSLQSSCN